MKRSAAQRSSLSLSRSSLSGSGTETYIHSLVLYIHSDDKRESEREREREREREYGSSSPRSSSVAKSREWFGLFGRHQQKSANQTVHTSQEVHMYIHLYDVHRKFLELE